MICVPNFAQVTETVSRGGDPSLKGWSFLKGAGVTDVVKLNTELEGDDAGAVRRGMRVHRFPIPWWRQALLRPKQSMLYAAVDVIRSGKCVFIHCERGQDRTGLVMACWRLSCGMSKDKAYTEMLNYGFHPELHGLLGRWQTQREEDWR
jgi:tyrosine-protein phosphatase SIW14